MKFSYMNKKNRFFLKSEHSTHWFLVKITIGRISIKQNYVQGERWGALVSTRVIRMNGKYKAPVTKPPSRLVHPPLNSWALSTRLQIRAHGSWVPHLLGSQFRLLNWRSGVSRSIKRNYVHSVWAVGMYLEPCGQGSWVKRRVDEARLWMQARDALVELLRKVLHNSWLFKITIPK